MYYEKKTRNLEFISVTKLSKPNLHIHNEVEIIINMGDGALANIYINSKKFLLQPGEAALIMPGQAHTSETLSEGRFLMYIFPPDYTPKLTNFFATKRPVHPIINLKETGLETIVLELWSKHSRTYDSQVPHALSTLIIGNVNVLMSQMLLSVEFCDINSDTKLYNRVIQYINDNYTEQISLKELSEELKVPPAIISIVFNSTSGITVPSFLNWVRVSAAAKLLESTNDNITDISTTVGFRTIRNFNRTFNDFFGVTPSTYRKNHK